MSMDANKSWTRTYDESVASLGGLSFVKLGDRDMNFWDEGRPPTRRTRRETGKKEECG